MQDERRRVTVIGARRRVDLAVPAHAPIAEYTPNLLYWCGQLEFDNTFPPAWSLALPGAPAFAPEASLAELGVLDGATLYLRDSAEAEFDEPLVTDLEEMVAQANRTGDTWGERYRAYTMVVLGIVVAVAGFAVLLGAAHQRQPVAFGTVVVGGGLAMLASRASRANWPLPLFLRLVIALATVPLFALATASLPVDQGGTGQVLVALGLGAMLGAAAAFVLIRHVVTLMVLLFAMLAFPVIALTVWLEANRAQAAAVTALVAIAVLSAAPHVAGKLAEMTSPEYPDTIVVPAAPTVEAEVGYLVSLGRRTLVAIIGICAGVLTCCLVVLGSAHEMFAVAMAGCVSLALWVRSGQLKMQVTVLPLIVAGCAGLVAALLGGASVLDAPGWVGPLIMLVLSISAVAVGVMGALNPFDATHEPPSWLGGLSAALCFLSVILAFGGVFGLFSFLMRLGEGL